MKPTKASPPARLAILEALRAPVITGSESVRGAFPVTFVICKGPAPMPVPEGSIPAHGGGPAPIHQPGQPQKEKVP